MKNEIPVFDTFDPAYYVALRAKVLKNKQPQPDMIRAIAEAEERSAQAEIHLITRRDSRNETEWRKTQMKRGKK